MLGWLSYFSQRVTNGAPHYLSSPKYSLTFRLLTYTVQLWPIFKKKENISFSVNVWESPLPVCPPNTVCTWFLPAVMLRWSSDNMFSWSDLQLLLCFLLWWKINELKGKLGSLRRISVKSGRHELESPIPSYPVHLLQNQSWQPGTPIK